ncbi:MAG: hypothetical protein P1Q69_17490 [Candidatus Thorarchaeota archaeon]|nr:hypothetical protein [Candidatus Thorarchaeota archaeon]
MPKVTEDSISIGLPTRINAAFFEPHPDIKGSRKRQQAQYLSILLMLGVPVFLVAQLVTDLTTHPLYLALSMTFFGGYILSRTQHYDLTAAITVL